jgi:hypothetical protein
MSEDNDGCGCTTMIAWWVGAVILSAVLGPCFKSCESSTPKYEYRPTTPTPTKRSTTPTKRSTKPTPVQPSSYWSGSSNGYTWMKATYAQKKWICDKMANQAGTSSYWMNFFNNFYGSPATNSTSMSDASKLAEVGL